MTTADITKLMSSDLSLSEKQIVAKYHNIARENGMVVIGMNKACYFFSGIIECILPRDTSKMTDDIYLNLNIKQASKTPYSVKTHCVNVLQAHSPISFYIEIKDKSFIKDENGNQFIVVLKLQ